MSTDKPTPSGLPAAIYARISKDRDNDREGVSRQIELCRALAKRLGWEVVAEFVDNDISAASGKTRPEYRAMLDAVRAGRVRGILAWHTDRLHRRPVELEEFITLAEAHDLKVQTEKSGDLNLSTPGGRMVARMLGAAARAEVDTMKERIRAAKDDAAAKGKYRGGPRPFGYERDGVTVRESEAEIVREATTAILAGRTLASVARELKERGVTGTNGTPVNYNNMRDMLLRPRNAGILARGLPNRTPKGGVRQDGQVMYAYEELGKAGWPAIVPEDQWRALVALICDPSRVTNDGRRETKHLGSGIYRCGVPTGEVDAEGQPIRCGAALRTAPHGGKSNRRKRDERGDRMRTPEDPNAVATEDEDGRRRLYRCTSKAHLTVSKNPTDDFVRKVVAAMLRDPENATVQAAFRAPGVDVTQDNAERAKLLGLLESFKVGLEEGNLTPADFRRATERVSAKIDAIDVRVGEAYARSVAPEVMSAADPGAAYLAASIDVQRSLLSALLRVHVVPQARRGSTWSSDRLLVESAV